MKCGRLAIPALAALVLAQVIVGVARAGGDHGCHGPGYHDSYGGYHNGYRDRSHRYGGYGHGTSGTGERESSRSWQDPTYGTGDMDRSPRSLGTDFARQNQRVHPGRFHIPPGHQPSPGSCRLWYRDQPAGHQPPPGDCGSLESLIL